MQPSNSFNSASKSTPLSSNQIEQFRIRLTYLDGLRGLTALYVVTFHVYQECVARGDFPKLLFWLAKPVAYAEAAVSIFIVLSGYCLMLPVVQGRQGYIPGGIFKYVKRRSQRILPPYYAALALSLLLLLLTIIMQRWLGVQWNSSVGFQPGVTPSVGALLSHLLLVQNWNLDWDYKINGPMWTMATEWQIYFLLPFVLLPIYRRFGILTVVVFSFVVGFGCHYVWPNWPDYTVSPWFLGLFSLGMAAADINFSHCPALIRWRQQLPWKVISLSLMTVVIAIFAPQAAPMGPSKLLSCLVGLATACLLVYCTRTLTERHTGHSSIILRLFEHPLSVKLGVFSFSLYLTHAPVVILTHQFLLRLHLSPSVTFLTLLIVAVPLALLTAYIFYLNFEKPFLFHRKAT